MKFTMVSTGEKKTLAISWLEVNSSAGNFVIQLGHAPMILILSANKPVTVCLNNGKQETFIIPGGILDVRRDEATLLLTQ